MSWPGDEKRIEALKRAWLKLPPDQKTLLELSIEKARAGGTQQIRVSVGEFAEALGCGWDEAEQRLKAAADGLYQAEIRL